MQEQSKRDRQGNLKKHEFKHREMAWQRVGKKYIYIYIMHCIGKQNKKVIQYNEYKACRNKLKTGQNNERSGDWDLGSTGECRGLESH